MSCWLSGKRVLVGNNYLQWLNSRKISETTFSRTKKKSKMTNHQLQTQFHQTGKRHTLTRKKIQQTVKHIHCLMYSARPLASSINVLKDQELDP